MGKVVVISVAGGSGSGKTTVVDKIIASFKKKEVRVIRVDDYYKKLDNISLEERKLINYDHPNSLDFDLFINQVNELREGKTIEKPLYDYIIHNRKEETERIEPAKILILEGILVMYPEEVRNISDIKVFVDTDPDIRFIRRLQRDTIERGRSVESVIKQYLSTVRPMHEAFVEPTKKFADIIIPNEFSHDVAVSVITTKIKEILQDKNWFYL